MVTTEKRNVNKQMKNIISYITLALALAAVGLSVFNFLNKKETAYLELGRVYDEFTMKEEMENQLNGIFEGKKQQLDSLLLLLEAEQRSLQTKSHPEQTEIEAFQSKRDLYNMQEEKFYSDMDRLKGNYTEKVWNQINQYISDYGKEKHIDLLLGAAGNGGVMYGDDAINLTDQVIEYINSRYQGKPSLVQ